MIIQTRKSWIRGPLKIIAAVMALSFLLFTFVAGGDYFYTLEQTNPMLSGFFIFIGFLAVCGGIYCSGLTCFSIISGWIRLSRLSPAPDSVKGDTGTIYSGAVSMGLVDYGWSVTIRFTDTGLIFSRPWYFAFMYRPIIITYERIGDVHSEEPSGRDIEFVIEGIRIKISGESAEALKKKKQDPSLPLSALGHDGSVARCSMIRGEVMRSTKRRRLDELHPLFVRAVRDFMNSKKKGEIEDSILQCYETRYMKKWFFGMFISHDTGMIITREWFFWGISDGESTSVGCTMMKHLAGMSGFQALITNDSFEIQGIDISGFSYDESHLNSWIIDVDRETAGEAFRQELAEAVRGCASA